MREILLFVFVGTPTVTLHCWLMTWMAANGLERLGQLWLMLGPIGVVAIIGLVATWPFGRKG